MAEIGTLFTMKTINCLYSANFDNRRICSFHFFILKAIFIKSNVLQYFSIFLNKSLPLELLPLAKSMTPTS